MKRWKLAAAKSPRVLGVLLSLTIALSSTGLSARTALAASADQAQEVLEETLTTGTKAHASESGKRETVYVIGDAAGKTKDIIVSEWLRNKDGAASLRDYSDLKDIENVEGYETFTREADGSMTWQADGADIYYQGTTDKKLPVDVSVSYKLDGRAISPEDLAGKSGKVTIRFDYQNHAETAIRVNGREETIKVPFAMISGCVLPSDHFSNVEVTNGRVTSEGSNSIVIGVAFPGLKDSLSLSSLKKDLDDADTVAKIDDLEEDIPEYVEITADCTDFELGMTMTLAESDLLSQLDLDDLDLGKLNDDMDELSDATDELVDGVETLKDGTGELSDGAARLADGAGTLDKGTGTLADGASKIADGSGTLAEGASALAGGASQAASGAGDLADGASQVADGAAALKAGTGQLAAGAGDLIGGASRLSDNVSSQLVPGTQALADGAAALLNGAGALSQGAHQTADGAASLRDGLDQLDQGLDQIDAGIDSLDQGTQALLAGDGIPALAEGAGTVSEGVSQVNAAIQTVHSLLAGVGDLPTLTQQTADMAALLQDVDPETLKADAAALMEASEKLQKLQGRIDEEYKSLQSEADSAKAESDEAKKARDAAKAALEEAREALRKVRSASSMEEPAKPSADAVYSALGSLSAEASQGEDGEVSASVKGREAVESALDSYTAAVAKYQEDMEAYAEAARPADMTAAQDAYDSAYAAFTAADADYEDKLSRAEEKAGKAEGFARAREMVDIDASAYTKAASDTAGLFTTLSALKENMTKIGSGLQGLGDFSRVVGTVQGLAARTPELEEGAKKVHESLQALYAVNPEDPAGSGPLVLLSAGASQLDQGMVPIMQGMDDAAAGAGSLAAGTQTVAAGVDQLSEKMGGLKDGAAQISDGTKVLDQGARQLLAGAQAAGAGIGQLDQGAASLSDGASQAAAGASALSAGVSGLSDGASRLSEGTDSLAEGASQLSDGAKALKEGTAALADGAGALSDGTGKLDEGVQELLDGVIKYRDEGISRLTDLFGGSITDVTDRLKGISEAGGAYTSYAGAVDDDNNEVRFIFKTDAISAED